MIPIPRTSRVAAEYLHVIVRGIGKQILFEEAADYKKYLTLLKKYKDETGLSILAYCLMENHVHMLIQDPFAEISVFMHRTSLCYAQYYNLKYNRTGHLFQDRFRSEVIRDQKHLISTFRYILNNPVKAGICSAQDYPWSSFFEFSRSGMLTNSELISELINGKDNFLQFMMLEDTIEHIEVDRKRRDDAWALSIIQNTLNVTSGTMLQQFGKKERNQALVQLKEKGLSIRQIERLTGINRGIIQKAKTI